MNTGTGAIPQPPFNEAFINSYTPSLNDITVYPNPASSEIVLSYPASDGNIIMLLTGQDGMVVGMEILPAASTGRLIDISNLKSGRYMMILQNKHDRRMVKFIKN